MEKLFGDFSVGLVFWQSVLFVTLFLLLRKYAWKPILNAINERESHIEDALNQAKKAKEDMANLTAENERIIREAKTERDSILKEANEIKNNIISEAKNAAKNEGDKMIELAKKSIETEKLAALTDLKNQVANLSINIAEKVVKNELSSKAEQQKLVDTLLKESHIN